VRLAAVEVVVRGVAEEADEVVVVGKRRRVWERGKLVWQFVDMEYNTHRNEYRYYNHSDRAIKSRAQRTVGRKTHIGG
jgi:hypothetical protein